MDDLDRVPDVVKSVEVTDGNQTVNFQLTLAAVREQVTITATGSAEAVSSSYQAVNSVGALELAQKNPVSIGEALEGQLGVRSEERRVGKECRSRWSPYH